LVISTGELTSILAILVDHESWGWSCRRI
jgi:hypothetical protein